MQVLQCRWTSYNRDPTPATGADPSGQVAVRCPHVDAGSLRLDGLAWLAIKSGHDPLANQSPLVPRSSFQRIPGFQWPQYTTLPVHVWTAGPFCFTWPAFSSNDSIAPVYCCDTWASGWSTMAVIRSYRGVNIRHFLIWYSSYSDHMFWYTPAVIESPYHDPHGALFIFLLPEVHHLLVGSIPSVILFPAFTMSSSCPREKKRIEESGLCYEQHNTTWLYSQCFFSLGQNTKIWENASCIPQYLYTTYIVTKICVNAGFFNKFLWIHLLTNKENPTESLIICFVSRDFEILWTITF